LRVKPSRAAAFVVFVTLAVAWAAGPADAGLLQQLGVKAPRTPSTPTLIDAPTVLDIPKALGITKGLEIPTTTQQWAPAATATIHPGVQTRTDGGQCTANFVFFDSLDNVYIGQAAHCSGTGGSTETNGCETGVLPLGTQVQVGGASQPGEIVYNSWVAMQQAHEGNLSTCLGNDFALVKLHASDIAKVNPSVPFWGGPTGGFDSSTSLGDQVYGYGNSSLRGGITALSPKVGIATGDSNNGWTHDVYTVTPGIPGDSGSAYLGSSGGALGVLSTLALPDASNQVSDLSRAMAYMYAHTALDSVQLAEGTETFAPLL
jgi:hypothetical protein